METNNLANTNQAGDAGVSSFEIAFARLESILEQMNTGAISLDDSLKLYEEADKLIAVCSKRLNEAERRIEVLVKNRNGDLILGNDGKPMVEKQ